MAELGGGADRDGASVAASRGPRGHQSAGRLRRDPSGAAEPAHRGRPEAPRGRRRHRPRPVAGEGLRRPHRGGGAGRDLLSELPAAEGPVRHPVARGADRRRDRQPHRRGATRRRRERNRRRAGHRPDDPAQDHPGSGRRRAHGPAARGAAAAGRLRPSGSLRRRSPCRGAHGAGARAAARAVRRGDARRGRGKPDPDRRGDRAPGRARRGRGRPRSRHSPAAWPG